MAAIDAPDPALAPGVAPAFAMFPGLSDMVQLLARGGPAIWAIAALSVAALALVLWKLWRLAASGAWRRAGAEAAVALWLDDRRDAALTAARAAPGHCAQMLAATLGALHAQGYDAALAGDEATRTAKAVLARAASGLRALELIATIAPLLGLLGTVLGMIAAFQALQATGARADPAQLAGGIWEALLTTAAGMAVAIPASAALTWFESVIARLRRDMEDMAVRVLAHAAHQAALARAAAPGAAA